MMVATSLLPDVLNFGSDLHLRYQWFLPESMGHPAKLHLGLLSWIVDWYTRPGQTILDPMAGIGSVLYAATLQRNVIAKEIEPRWLEVLHKNAAHILEQSGLFAGQITVGQADACEAWGVQADCIITSPPYGCSASTSANARKMLPYRQSKSTIQLDERWHRLHAHPSAGAMGALSFHYGNHPAQIGHFRGNRYWQAMERMYTQAHTSLRPSGFLILILKDHIFQGKRVRTAEKTIALCESIGFTLYARHQRHVYPLSLWQRRRKERGEPVVEEEDVLVFCHKQESEVSA